MSQRKVTVFLERNLPFNIPVRRPESLTEPWWGVWTDSRGVEEGLEVNL